MSADLLFHPAVQSGVVPFAIAAALAPLLGRFGGAWAEAAVAAAFLAVYPLIIGWPGWPPVGATQKLGWLAAAALPVGAALVTAPPRRQLVAAVIGALGGLAWLAAPRLAGGELAAIGQVALIAACIAAGLVAVWLALDDGIAGGIMLLAGGIGLGLVALLGGSASIFQLAAALAAATGGVLAWNWPRQRWPLGAVTLAAAVVLGLLAAQTALYTRASGGALLLLLPILLVRLPLGPARRLAPWSRMLAVGLLAAIPVAAAGIVAVLAGGEVYAG